MPTIYRDILAPGGRHADPDPSARIPQPHNTGLSIVPKQNRPRRPRTTIRRFMKCRVTGAAGRQSTSCAVAQQEFGPRSPECRRTSMNAKQVRRSDGSGCGRKARIGRSSTSRCRCRAEGLPSLCQPTNQLNTTRTMQSLRDYVARNRRGLLPPPHTQARDRQE
jgi:hypothetical protein